MNPAVAQIQLGRINQPPPTPPAAANSPATSQLSPHPPVGRALRPTSPAPPPSHPAPPVRPMWVGSLRPTSEPESASPPVGAWLDHARPCPTAPPPISYPASSSRPSPSPRKTPPRSPPRVHQLSPMRSPSPCGSGFTPDIPCPSAPPLRFLSNQNPGPSAPNNPVD